MPFGIRPYETKTNQHQIQSNPVQLRDDDAKSETKCYVFIPD